MEKIANCRKKKKKRKRDRVRARKILAAESSSDYAQSSLSIRFLTSWQQLAPLAQSFAEKLREGLFLFCFRV